VARGLFGQLIIVLILLFVYKKTNPPPQFDGNLDVEIIMYLWGFPSDSNGHLVTIKLCYLSGSRPADLKRVRADGVGVEGDVMRPPRHSSIGNNL
jgi:hypothetical protein